MMHVFEHILTKGNILTKQSSNNCVPTFLGVIISFSDESVNFTVMPFKLFQDY